MTLKFETSHEYHTACMNLMWWDDMLYYETEDNDNIQLHGVELKHLVRLFNNVLVNKYPDLASLAPYDLQQIKSLKTYFEKLDV